jgi:hypothetical protein
MWQTAGMPVVSALVLGFALGAGLAWATARALSRAVQGLASRALLIVGLLALLAYAPAVILIATLAPAWSYTYLVDPQLLPSWLMPVYALLVAGSVPLGYASALARPERARGSFRVRWFVVSAVLGLLVLAPGLPRLTVVATFEQFHADYGVQPVAGAPLGYALIWMLAGVSVASLCTYRALASLATLGRDAA